MEVPRSFRAGEIVPGTGDIRAVNSGLSVSRATNEPAKLISFRTQHRICRCETRCTAKIGSMRIGTWNMEGKWSPDHHALLTREKCDVWLLTEVCTDVAIPGMRAHRTEDFMGHRKNWAGIFSALDFTVEPDPHRATAMARLDEVRFICSILPWRSCGSSWPGATLTDKQSATLAVLGKYLDGNTVWGGDWNQALEGPEYVGSLDGRRQIIELTRQVALSVPTSTLGSAATGHRTIDHISVPIGWDIDAAYRVAAQAGGHRLSDHDAYVVSAAR
jgi:hypothetical protein